MESAQEIIRWLKTLPEDADVFIDEGGLTLRQDGGEAYLEVGGEPLDEDEEL